MRITQVLLLFVFLLISAGAQANTQKLSTIDDVVDEFQKLTINFKREKNHRLVFASTYLDSTVEIKKSIENNIFNYPQWVEYIVVDFANLYLKSLKNYKRYRIAPLSWREAFKLNDQRYEKLSVQLLLAMNAHIYHDLPIALMQSFDKGFSPAQVENDFLKMNDIFEMLTPKFMNLLYDLEKILGINKKRDQRLDSIQSRIKMRSDAWDLGIQLHESSGRDRINLLNKINQDAGDNASTLLNLKFLIPSH